MLETAVADWKLLRWSMRCPESDLGSIRHQSTAIRDHCEPSVNVL